MNQFVVKTHQVKVIGGDEAEGSGGPDVAIDPMIATQYTGCLIPESQCVLDGTPWPVLLACNDNYDLQGGAAVCGGRVGEGREITEQYTACWVSAGGEPHQGRWVVGANKVLAQVQGELRDEARTNAFSAWSKWVGNRSKDCSSDLASAVRAAESAFKEEHPNIPLPQ